MKNKAGFTLIEVLASIIIVAIVALTTVPIILNIIETTKKRSFEITAYGLVESANVFYSSNLDKIDTYTFYFDNGKRGETDAGHKIDFKGDAPSSGFVRLYSDGYTDLSICNQEYCACKGKTTSKVFVLDIEEGICGLNEDGSVANNPITTAMLTEIQNQIDNLSQKDVELTEMDADLQNQSDQLRSDIEAIDNNLSQQISTMVSDIGTSVYPIGSIYLSLDNTNPSELFGGTWLSYAEGRTLVGVGTGEDSNNIQRTFTVNQIGGEYLHKLSIAELPSHSHSGTTNTDGEHRHGMDSSSSDSFYGNIADGSTTYGSDLYTHYAGDHSHSFTTNSIGGNNYHNIIQPYTTVYMWKRTA